MQQAGPVAGAVTQGPAAQAQREAAAAGAARTVDEASFSVLDPESCREQLLLCVSSEDKQQLEEVQKLAAGIREGSLSDEDVIRGWIPLLKSLANDRVWTFAKMGRHIIRMWPYFACNKSFKQMKAALAKVKEDPDLQGMVDSCVGVDVRVGMHVGSHSITACRRAAWLRVDLITLINPVSSLSQVPTVKCWLLCYR